MQARPGVRLAAAVGACAAGVLLAGALARVAASELASGPCELSSVTERDRTPSQRCLSCHDGSAGAGATFDMRRGFPGFATSHPVEVDYGAVAAAAADRFRPPWLLPPSLPLVDGKVACTTCHDGGSPFPNHVVDPVRLCSACHQM